MEQNQTYTVFSEHGFQNTDYDGWRGLTLEQTIDRAANELGMKLIAWAPEGVLGYEGKKNTPTLRAESIAAGRLIEKVDGKYVARGMEEASKQNLTDLLKDWVPFSVRNGYREKKLPELTWADTKPVDRFPGFSVTSGECDLHRPGEGLTHPLQKMAEGKDGFGSAALLKG